MWALLLAVVLLNAGCAGGSSKEGAVVAHVGPSVVLAGAVEHWTQAIQRGAPVAFSDAASVSPRARALTFLVSTDWFFDEAARHGRRLSSGERDRLMRGQEAAVVGGGSFQSYLDQYGLTRADFQLETEAEWARQIVRRILIARAQAKARSQVTMATIAEYYTRHKSSYFVRERRHYDIVERLRSAAAAQAIGRRLGAGRRFTAHAVEETYYRPRTYALAEHKGTFLKAVFEARPGAVSEPLLLKGRYTIFVLRRILPAEQQPLAKVAGAIEQTLLGSAQRRASTAVAREFSQQWISTTSCAAGFVVQKCKEYRGSRSPEADLLALA